MGFLVFAFASDFAFAFWYFTNILPCICKFVGQTGSNMREVFDFFINCFVLIESIFCISKKMILPQNLPVSTLIGHNRLKG